MTRVVDTSIVLKWVVAESDSVQATKWAGTSLIAPDLIRAELGNALWKKVVRGEIESDQARRAIEETLPALSLVSSVPLIPRALSLALELSHPIYDCIFLTLALERGTVLVTADGRFARRCAESRYASSIATMEGKQDA